MATNYVKLHEKQIDKLIEQNEALHQEMKEMKDYFKETINSLKDELKKSNEENAELKKVIELLNEEIIRLKNTNNKDSSNSSKPSSTNGSKIIPNCREKSNKKAGGQHKHAHIH